MGKFFAFELINKDEINVKNMAVYELSVGIDLVGVILRRCKSVGVVISEGENYIGVNLRIVWYRDKIRPDNIRLYPPLTFSCPLDFNSFHLRYISLSLSLSLCLSNYSPYDALLPYLHLDLLHFFSLPFPLVFWHHAAALTYSLLMPTSASR